MTMSEPLVGIYGSSTEDRARASELNRYLDAHSKTIHDEQLFQDELEDQAAEVVKDSGYLFDIFQENADGFLDAVAKLIAESEQRAASSAERRDQQAAAYYDFRLTLIEMAKSLPSVQRLAEKALED
jgi:hypothetical protein